MVTRRSTHSHHAKSHSSAARRASRRSASANGSLYAGGRTGGSHGGHVGNVAGLGGAASGGGRRGEAPSVGNVAGLGGSSGPRPSGEHRRPTGGTADGPNGRGSTSVGGTHRAAGARSPRAADGSNGSGGVLGGSGGGFHIPTPNGGDVLLTRRHFLFGALGVGAVAALAGGGSVIVDQMQSASSDDLAVLTVPESSVTTSDACSEVDASERMALAGSFELPYGTLVWANDDDIAACLLPTEQSSPIAQVGLLALGSGSCTTVLEQAVGTAEGFEIYDVRATSEGVIWTEADILDGTWRIYTATSDGSSIGEPALVDEGDGEWQTPTIAAVGDRAFWQVLPRIDGSKKTEGSTLKRATMGASDAEIAFTSNGRMATPPYGLADSVVISPRTDTSSIHYQLTRLDARTNDVLDTMALPTSMRPLEAGYGQTGFLFSFDAIYNYGGGIANLGTYAPTVTVTEGSYSDVPWFRFNRTPTAAPAWCGSYLMVKSTLNVCGIDLNANESFRFEIENGADDYGEYLATTGVHDSIVTFTNVDDNPVNGEPRKCCVVKVWKPLA